MSDAKNIISIIFLEFSASSNFLYVDWGAVYFGVFFLQGKKLIFLPWRLQLISWACYLCCWNMQEMVWEEVILNVGSYKVH